MKRQLVETLERRKEQMIAALWANSNFDDDKGTRQNAIEEIEENFEEAMQTILHGGRDEEEEIDKSNPFFAAAERGVAKLQAPRQDEGATVKDVVGDYSKDIDQN